jgi:hypothetical protein
MTIVTIVCPLPCGSRGHDKSENPVNNHTCREHFGELRFHEALLPGKVIPIPDEAIGQRKIWREIGELCRQDDGPLRLADFARHIGTRNLSRAAHHVRRAEKAGLMREIGWVGGWVAMD